MTSIYNLVMLIFAGLIMTQITSCTTSRLVDVWYDPSFNSPPLRKILIISVRKDAVKRRVWEDAFTEELAKHGVIASPSYRFFSDAPPDTNKISRIIEANRFEGILVILPQPTETKKTFIQGSSQRDIYIIPNRPYWQRYWTYTSEVYHPSYIDSQITDIRTIDVTTTGENGGLIWSATSRTPDPTSISDAQKSIVSLVVSELEKRMIINKIK